MNRVLQLENKKNLIEREYYFYMGQAMGFSYKIMLSELRRALEDSDRDRSVAHVLEMIMDSRLDDLEEKLKAESQEYSNALEEVYHQEESFYNMNLPKEKRVQVDRYITAVNQRWILYAEALYTAGDERYVGIEGTMKSIKCRCQRLRLMCAAIHIVPIWLSQE